VPEDYDQSPPLFSLERVQDEQYGYSALSVDEKAAFADAIFRRKSLKWCEITSSGRHGLGTERIPAYQIHAPIPRFITDDRDYFLSMRFCGMKPMVGYRVRNLFYVLWFDRDMTLYGHG
jgi:hypothetical protein